jgi:hypothetical protein
MKIGLWQYTSINGKREAVVVANDKQTAYDSLTQAFYPSLFRLVEWIGESNEECNRVILDAPMERA